MQRSNKINASSLCHFTKKFDTLQNIVKNGIRFSFAFEKLSPATIANFEYPSNPQLVAHIYKNAGVAIPMVSFCDIPITRATDHIAKYGQYMIGLDKEFIIDTYNKIINPVFYIHSDNLYQAIDDISNVYAETTNQQIQRILSIGNHVTIPTQQEVEEFVRKFPFFDRKINTRFIIGISKSCYSDDRKWCYYDEREWRAFWPDGISEVANWKWGITYEDYLSNRNDWNKDLTSDKTNYITIPNGFLHSGITHIVVKNDAQIPKMIDLIMRSKTIFGQSNVSQKDRLILVSKIASLERIAKDY